MSAESDFEEARRRIAKAKAEGDDSLDLRGLNDLAVLPPEIADLALTEIFLTNTQVSDITSLAAMTGMTRLDLANTQVSDITPLAAMTGMTTLLLTNTQVSDITPLAGVTGMTWLTLANTQVSDITPLAGMSGMTRLDLDNTQVSDLRIVLELPSLETPGRPFEEIRFAGCPATDLDPKLAEIAKVEHRDRAKRLFERLREIGDDWPPSELVPQDSPAAPHYVLEPDRPLHSLDTPPKGGDPDQVDLQEELRHKVRVLLETIGASNEYAPLKRSADTYMRQIDRRLSDIRLRILWSAANSLRLAINANQRADDEGRVNDMLPPLAAAALEDLVQTHGLFILGFPNAAELEAEMRSYLGRGRNPEQVEAAKEVVSALEGKDSAIEPEDNAALQADALAAAGTGPDAEMAEISLFARLGNMIGAAGRAMRKAVVAGSKAVLAHDFIQFLIGNQTLIMKYLKLAMDQASAWFPRLLDLVKVLIGG